MSPILWRAAPTWRAVVRSVHRKQNSMFGELAPVRVQPSLDCGGPSLVGSDVKVDRGRARHTAS